MKITLKDGSFKEYENAMCVLDIAKDISEGLARVACAGELNGEVVDLRTVVENDCNLNILTFDDEAGKKAFRHTAAHILAQAVKRLYPDAKCTIGPAIDEGFYYDFDMPSLGREELDKIEAVAAGTALVAIGSAVKTGLSNIASGGYSSSASVATSGNYGSSPSVSTAFDTREMNIKVSGNLYASGNQLMAVIENENNRKNHTT